MARGPIQFQKGLSLADFLADYGTDEQCRLALEKARWPDGFVCPHCGGRKSSFHSTRKLYRCSACRVQTSVTAGTIFHHSKLPLTKWFAGHVCDHPGEKLHLRARALTPPRRPVTRAARLMMLKLSQVMLEPGETKTLEGCIEPDGAYLGGERAGGKPGRGSENKRPFLAAVETREGRPQRVHFRRVATFSKEKIAKYAKASLTPGAHVVSDGLACFAGVTEAGCSHDVIITSRIHQAHKLSAFKWVNTLLGNLKTAMSGTLKATRDRHMARYLAEFEYRFNRRFDLAAQIEAHDPPPRLRRRQHRPEALPMAGPRGRSCVIRSRFPHAHPRLSPQTHALSPGRPLFPPGRPLFPQADHSFLRPDLCHGFWEIRVRAINKHPSRIRTRNTSKVEEQPWHSNFLHCPMPMMRSSPPCRRRRSNIITTSTTRPMSTPATS